MPKIFEQLNNPQRLCSSETDAIYEKKSQLYAKSQQIFIPRHLPCNRRCVTCPTGRDILWHTIVSIKGTLPRKSMWALNVQFSEKTTMVPFI